MARGKGVVSICNKQYGCGVAKVVDDGKVDSRLRIED